MSFVAVRMNPSLSGHSGRVLSSTTSNRYTSASNGAFSSASCRAPAAPRRSRSRGSNTRSKSMSAICSAPSAFSRGSRELACLLCRCAFGPQPVVLACLWLFRTHPVGCSVPRRRCNVAGARVVDASLDWHRHATAATEGPRATRCSSIPTPPWSVSPVRPTVRRPHHEHPALRSLHHRPPNAPPSPPNTHRKSQSSHSRSTPQATTTPPPPGAKGQSTQWAPRSAAGRTPSPRRIPPPR